MATQSLARPSRSARPPVSAPDPDTTGRLQGLLEHYEQTFGAMLRAAPAQAIDDLDACYAALRLRQRARWPAGASLVDALGCAAHDVLAVRDGRAVGGRSLQQELEAHRAAFAALREALAAGQALEVAA
jgi:hypothetical protein